MVPVSVPEIVEKPRVTEIQVRIDCNGCVQKIVKALHGITGIYDVSIDVPQQKLTIIGWADPEKLVRAVKKSRKTASICPDTTGPPPEPQTPEGGSNPADGAKPPPEGGPQPPENPQPTQENPNALEARPKDGGEVYIIYNSLQNYSGHHQYGGYPRQQHPYSNWYNNDPNAQALGNNTYSPPSYVVEYVEGPTMYKHYNRTALYGRDYQQVHLVQQKEEYPHGGSHPRCHHLSR